IYARQATGRYRWRCRYRFHPQCCPWRRRWQRLWLSRWRSSILISRNHDNTRDGRRKRRDGSRPRIEPLSAFAVWGKAPGDGIADEKHAGAYAEISAMQGKRSVFHRVAHGGEGHQVFEAVADHGPFEFPDPALPVFGGRADAFGHRRDLRHPFADEIALGQRSGIVGIGSHATTA